MGSYERYAHGQTKVETFIFYLVKEPDMRLSFHPALGKKDLNYR